MIVATHSRYLGAGIAVGCVALQAALALTAVLTTNPDYNFPGIVELALIGTALLCLAVAFGFGVRWERDDRRLAGALAVLLSVLALRYLSALGDASDISAIRCFAMPGIAGTAECLLQLPFWANHGLRQLLLHVTALVVFWAAAALARTAGGRVATFAPLFLITPLIFAVASVAPKFILGQQTLAGWNLVLNAFTGTARSASGLTSNPGWLWPLMAAPAALAVGLLASRNWPRVAVGGVVLAAICFAISDAGQRGGYVLLTLVAACACVYGGVWRVPTITISWRWRTLSWAAPLGVAMVAMWAGAGYLNAALGWMAQFPLFASFAGREFVLSDTSVRGVMWQCA
ncbi:MAG: hypothetical protein Q7V01_07190, partial [Vicinamibacterales bacterium]|nr:hypothetical protein [Vicinamibacterales bacterium]